MNVIFNNKHSETLLDAVMDGVTHFTPKREIAKCLLIENSDLTKSDNKWDGVLARGNCKVHWIIHCIVDRLRQYSQGDPAIELWGSERMFLLSEHLFGEEFRFSWMQT